MNNLTTTLLLLTVLVILLPAETYAFGAGDIPDFAYLNDKAFRHGDIENILGELAKTAGHVASSGGILGFAQSMLGAASGGAKFTKEDVKKVYFGNWLRDYSQAMDIAGLSKLSADTLVLIVSVLGFLTFGFATEEFEVTADRLGVYLPVEHIDNPKGYGEKEGDARQFHPKLRPPVNPEELKINQNTGMKNYMATENRGWDTSTAHIRRIFRSCIEHGRQARGQESADLWEAYRLMGTGLHTMEDLLAHSNWCEITLRKMGHTDVFCHVGDNVLINSPNGQAPPLVTGTFGSADFMHSMMGEATDHLSQASVVDLSKKMSDASQNDDNSFGNLKDILKKLPIGGGDTDSQMNQGDELHAKSKAYEFNPDDIAPPEVQQQLLQLLKWRDDIYRDIVKKLEMVPGLADLIDNLTNALNAYVYTILAPYLTPILEQVTSVLGEGSKAVIDSDDQYEVFNNPNASDPSHSLLSKDHFALILNEPAGKIALVVVQYSVRLLVNSWFDDGVHPDQVIDQILEAFHHPYYATGRSRIQQDMFEEMEKWVGSLGPEESEQVLRSLTKDAVREGKNKRQGSDDDLTQSNLVYGGRPAQGGGYPSSQGGGGYGSSQSQGLYASQPQGGYAGSSQSDYQTSQSGYGSAQGGYGSSQNQYGGVQERTDSYGEGRPNQNEIQPSSESYGGGGYGQSDNNSYGSGRRQAGRQSEYDTSYGAGRTEGHTGRTEGYGESGVYGSRPESYESGRGESYGGGRSEGHGGGEYGRRRHNEDSDNSYRPETGSESYGTQTGYGQTTTSYRSTEDSYSSRRPDEGGYSQTAYGSSEGYGSNTPGRTGYGNEDRGSYEGGYGQERGSSGYGRGGYGGEERSSYGRQERETGGYGGEPFTPSEYGRSEESSGYGESRRNEGGYGNETSYGRSSQGEGYGGSGGYHGGGEETFGAERLRLDDDNSDGEHRHHGHHKKHHDDDD